MTKRLNILICSSILILGLCSSCILLIARKAEQKNMRKSITVEEGVIPADFGKSKATMLVIKEGKSKSAYDKYLEKDFEKYTGDLKIVKLSEVESDKYKDKTKYRYVFHFTSEGREIGDKTVNVKRFFILDRTDNKKYINKYTSSNFSLMRKTYAENLEKEIKKE